MAPCDFCWLVVSKLIVFTSRGRLITLYFGGFLFGYVVIVASRKRPVEPDLLLFALLLEEPDLDLGLDYFIRITERTCSFKLKIYCWNSCITFVANRQF